MLRHFTYKLYIRKNKIKRCIIRLSVEDSNNKGNSIENQKLIIDDYIARNVNLQLHDRYIYNGATGMDFNRPQFQRMLDDIEKGVIQCVMLKDFSRFGRNSIEVGYFTQQVFPLFNVRFIYSREKRGR